MKPGRYEMQGLLRMMWPPTPGLQLAKIRAISSVGRALHSHCRGHWFETGIAHHFLSLGTTQN